MLGCRCSPSRESSSSNHGRRTMRPTLTGHSRANTSLLTLHTNLRWRMTSTSPFGVASVLLLLLLYAHGGLAIECRVPWDIQNVKHTQLKLGISLHSLSCPLTFGSSSPLPTWLTRARCSIVNNSIICGVMSSDSWSFVMWFFFSWKNAFVMQSIVVNNVSYFLGREFLRRHQV